MKESCCSNPAIDLCSFFTQPQTTMEQVDTGGYISSYIPFMVAEEPRQEGLGPGSLSFSKTCP